MELGLAIGAFAGLFVAFAVLPTQIRKYHQRRHQDITGEDRE
jgi:uncharacterized protein with PQ loop repeat